MMSTQSYYDAGDHESFHLTPRRSMSTSGYYDRLDPYTAYYEPRPRQDPPAGYGGHVPIRAVIHEPDPDGGHGGSSRRRIAVACTRCRRRKIKCSGDPGDGTGCHACRSSSAMDLQSCNFIRVGSQELPMQNDTSASRASVSSSRHSSDYVSAVPGSSLPSVQARSSLPVLHNRQALTAYGYDPCDNASTDNYNASGGPSSTARVPKQDSAANTGAFEPGRGLENYCPRSTASTTSNCAPSSYYEMLPGYSFGGLQAPTYLQAPDDRLPSITGGDTMSSLNMASLHSSLPTQTVQERTLPVPYASTSYSGVEYPEHRPPQRDHITGLPSRSAGPWSMDSAGGTLRTTPSGHSTYLGRLPMSTSVAQQLPTPTLPESTALSYQFSAGDLRSVESPQLSPTTGPLLLESFPSTMSASSQYQVSSGNLQYIHESLRPTTSEEQRPFPSREPIDLYSYSSDARDRSTTSDTDQSPITAHSYMQMRAPQPMHTPNIETLRRQSSFDQQRTATAHRMSLSNLNSHC